MSVNVGYTSMQSFSLFNNRCLPRVEGGRGFWRYLLVCLMLGIFPLCGQAQITLNVKDFGAKGDAVQFYVNTVSNSVVVTTTNQCSTADIGKFIEIFRVGKPTYGRNSYGVTTNDNQDLMAVVTNVVAGTNLYLNVVQISGGTTNILPQVTGSAWATMGTDNTPIVNGIITNQAAGYTNATIYFPAGKYLCMSSVRSGGYGAYAILIRRGGLHFLGENKTNTILLSRAAWQSWGNGTYPVRGFLFELVGPVTNDYPLIFENLTMDGGVLQGNLTVHGIQCNQVDGLGWDEQHSAVLEWDIYGASGTVSMQVFTNVDVLHWRGESFKSIDQNTNGTIDIQHCTFGDICATALNIYPRWNIRNNLFTNCFQITEYYQQFYRGTAFFCNNVITNSLSDAGYGTSKIGNAISVNGGWSGASPLVIQSNYLRYASGYGMNTFITTPGENVSILDNTIDCMDYAQVFNFGAPGAQGSGWNKNILVSNNYISNTNKGINIIAQFGGSTGPDTADTITICSNRVVSSGLNMFIQCGRYATNILVYDNDLSAVPNCTIQTGSGPW